MSIITPVCYPSCEKCLKEMSKNSTRNAEKINRRICTECHFFELIGVFTIQDYNN